MDAGVEIGAAVDSKTAPFIAEDVARLLLFPRRVTRTPGGWLVRFEQAEGYCKGAGHLHCGRTREKGSQM